MPVAADQILQNQMATAWEQGFRGKVRRVLIQQVRECVTRLRDGQSLLPNDSRAWEFQLFTAQRADVLAMAVEGYKVADALFFQTKAQTIYIGDPDEFLITPMFQPVDDWLGKVAASETQSHRNNINRIFKNASKAELGLTPNQIARQVLAEGIKATLWESKRIARTTSIWAMNEGSMLRYKKAGVAVSEWYVTDDDLTCEFCSQMGGARVRTGDSFWPAGSDLDGLQFPQAIMHPPLHPNCRCVLLPVTSGGEIMGPPKPVLALPSKPIVPRKPKPTVPTVAPKPVEVAKPQFTKASEYREEVLRLADPNYKPLVTDDAFEQQKKLLASLSDKASKINKEISAINKEIRTVVQDSPEYLALRERRKALFPELNALDDEVRGLARAVKKKTGNIIDKQRAVFFEKDHVDLKLSDQMFNGNPPNKFRKTMVEAAQDFEKMIPKKVGAAFAGQSPLSRFSVTNRAGPNGVSSYDIKQRILLITSKAKKSSFIHEFGHHFSYNIKNATLRNRAFFDKRTAGENVKQLVGKREGIVGKKDRFKNSYTGRVYRDGSAPEIFSTGVEQLYINPAAFAKSDPEFFDHVVSLLKGLK